MKSPTLFFLILGSLAAQVPNPTQQGAVKARMHEAGTKLEASRSKMGNGVHESTEAAKGKLDQARAKLLDGMTSATRSLSEAVAAKRTGALASQTATKPQTASKKVE